ncbi:hypothetical protein KEM54_004332, partial [Ascosphaera aggregata]
NGDFAMLDAESDEADLFVPTASQVRPKPGRSNSTLVHISDSTTNPVSRSAACALKARTTPASTRSRGPARVSRPPQQSLLDFMGTSQTPKREENAAPQRTARLGPFAQNEDVDDSEDDDAFEAAPLSTLRSRR